MSVHSWHHHTRWPEVHPFAERKYQQRCRRDDLRAAFGILFGMAIGSGCTVILAILVLIAIGVAGRGVP